MYKIQFLVKELQDNQVNPELQEVDGQVRQARQVKRTTFIYI